MKKIILTVIITIVVAISILVIIISLSVKTIDKKGQIDLAKDNLNTQITKAVGGSNVNDFTSLLEIAKYPGVSEYLLSRDKNFDHNWSQISFQTSDKFDKVLTYYKNKFPNKEFSIDSTPKGGQVAYFNPINEPGKIGRSFLFFTIQDPVKNIRMSIIEGVDDITYISATRTY